MIQVQAINESWLVWLESTAMASAVRQSQWLYPAVEIGHILGFVVVVGAAAMFDLRLLGLSRSLPVKEASRHLTRWARLGLIAVLPTGFILFMVSASSLAANTAFLIKISLIAAAGVNALVFHTIIYRTAGSWDMNSAPPVAARISGLISLLLWMSVITCGRLIAYV
ncbi:MAG: DUF6644 family protein [Balneolaceae bacterium]